MSLDLMLVDDAVWIISSPTRQQTYDFAISDLFPTKRPLHRAGKVKTVARIGAIENYEELYGQLMQEEIELIHDPDEHKTCSQLDGWYPILKEFTPRSMIFEKPPEVEEIQEHFDWPIFVKGHRQTSRHQRKLSIIEDVNQYKGLLAAYANDPILHWQKFVVREFVSLKPIEGISDEKSIPPSFEFRTFFWRQKLVGFGNYWTDCNYRISESEIEIAKSFALAAAEKVPATFLVVDIAQRKDGTWIVVECNDGQESGYAGIQRLALWQNIIGIEKEWVNSKNETLK